MRHFLTSLTIGWFLTFATAQAQDNQSIEAKIKELMFEKMEVEVTKIEHSGLTRTFATEFYTVECNFDGSIDHFVYADTANGLVNVTKPSTSTPMPEMLETLKPTFKLATEKDGQLMLSAFKALYAKKNSSFNKIEPRVAQKGRTWNFILARFFDDFSGFVVQTDPSGKIHHIEYSLGIEVE